MRNFPKRGEIFWVNLDPTRGSEINKTRPTVIVSNDDGNEKAQRVIVAPITSSMRKLYPFEVAIEIKSKSCKILLDQVRAIDKIRLGDRIMTLEQEIMDDVDKALKIALGLV